MDGFILEAPPNKKVVLLLHGMTGGPIELAQFGKYIHKKGYDVYCPVIPGHCRGIEEIRSATWQDWHVFALNQFDELNKKYEEVYVSGICLGAVLAFDIAQERPKDVAGVGGLSTTLFLDGWGNPWFKFLFPLGLYTVLKFFYSFPESEPYGTKNERIRKQVVKILKEDPSILDCFPMVSIKELLSLSGFVRKNVHKISTPFILLHSTLDDITSLKSSDFIFINASSKIKQYIELKDSYHLIIRDNERRLVFEKTVNFFDEISSKISKKTCLTELKDLF